MLADKVFSNSSLKDLLNYADNLWDSQAEEEAIVLFDVAIEKIKSGSPDTEKAQNIILVFGDNMPKDKWSLIRLLTRLR